MLNFNVFCTNCLHEKKNVEVRFIATVFHNIVFMCFADKIKLLYTSQFILKYKKQ